MQAPIVPASSTVSQPAMVAVVMGPIRIENVDKLALMSISKLATEVFNSPSQPRTLELPPICERAATFAFLQWAANGYYTKNYSMSFLRANSFACNLDIYVTAAVLDVPREFLLEIEKFLTRAFTAIDLEWRDSLAMDQFLEHVENFRHPQDIFWKFFVQVYAHRLARSPWGSWLDLAWLRKAMPKCHTIHRLVEKAWAGKQFSLPHLRKTTGSPEGNKAKGSHLRRQLRSCAGPEVLFEFSIVPLLDEDGAGTIFASQQWGIPAEELRNRPPTEGGLPPP